MSVKHISLHINDQREEDRLLYEIITSKGLKKKQYIYESIQAREEREKVIEQLTMENLQLKKILSELNTANKNNVQLINALKVTVSEYEDVLSDNIDKYISEQSPIDNTGSTPNIEESTINEEEEPIQVDEQDNLGTEDEIVNEIDSQVIQEYTMITEPDEPVEPIEPIEPEPIPEMPDEPVPDQEPAKVEIYDYYDKSIFSFSKDKPDYIESETESEKRFRLANNHPLYDRNHNLHPDAVKMHPETGIVFFGFKENINGEIVIAKSLNNNTLFSNPQEEINYHRIKVARETRVLDKNAPNPYR